MDWGLCSNQSIGSLHICMLSSICRSSISIKTINLGSELPLNQTRLLLSLSSWLLTNRLLATIRDSTSTFSRSKENLAMKLKKRRNPMDNIPHWFLFCNRIKDLRQSKSNKTKQGVWSYFTTKSGFQFCKPLKIWCLSTTNLTMICQTNFTRLTWVSFI